MKRERVWRTSSAWRLGEPSGADHLSNHASEQAVAIDELVLEHN